MKRDMDLVRSIMLHIEECENLNFALPNYDDHAIGYHVRLLKEAELIHAVAVTTLDGNIILQNAGFTALSWDGHEFLDAARDNNRWNKAKKVIVEKAGSISVELLKQYLMKLMKDSLGLNNP